MRNVFFLSLIILVASLQGQTIRPEDQVPKTEDSAAVSGCVQKDVFDVLFRRKPELQDTIERLTSFFLPYVGYSPSTGFIFGLGGTLSFRLGKRDSTNLSGAAASIEFTTEKQLILQAKSNIFAGKNRWFLQGDWRFLLYNIPTYGLSTGRGYCIPEIPGVVVDPEDRAVWSTQFPVQYSWFRFHETVSRRVGQDIYAGIGYYLDMHFDIQDLHLNIDSGETNLTPHYAYSVLHGFNPKKYTVSGLCLNFVYDTRDNLINPYKGVYVNINYADYLKFLGSDKEGSQLWTEFRTYFNVEKKLPRHLIALWFYGSFVLSGSMPFFDLGSIGYDQMSSSGRGYVKGRWRGENLIYGEVEYRFPISRCSQVLGGAVFVNATTASSKDLDVPLFGYIRAAAGAGIRIMVSRKSRTNIVIDFAVGDLSKGLYVMAQEPF